MTNKTIEAVTVERDEKGYWTHPLYERALFEDWEFETCIDLIEFTEDFNAANEYMINGSCTKWQPKKPDGDGWFIGSIHDTDDGAVCVWIRQNGAGNDE